MNQQEIINTIALTRINYFTLPGLLQLYRKLGSATAVVDHRNHIQDVLPDASPKLVESLRHMDEPLHRAEVEYSWMEQHKVTGLPFNSDDYPARLRECDDAPLMLFYRGNASLNQKRIICMVGTRHATAYGQDIIDRFFQELRNECPELLVVSGLAYGVDIMAHRAALCNGYDTVGVLAHGLDELYPARHRDTAVKMLSQGGLLTEFLSSTRSDKVNFVRRNRIVAGMSDACILVESAATGGGLITASLARNYNRDVFAFPGAVNAPYSEGCNNLIRDNAAALVSNAHDFVQAMGWESDQALQKARKEGIERQIFPSLTEEETLVAEVLQEANDEQINQLSVRTDIPVGRLTAILFSLEMKGVVRALAGGVYHLVGV